MKYTVLFLAAIGFTAAAVLPQKAQDLFFHNVRKHQQSNYNTNNNYNNNNNNYGANSGQQFLEKQQAVLQLLTNLQQYNPYKGQKANSFNPFENVNRFNNEKAVVRFLKNYENNDFLPQDEVFSPTIQQHQNQAAQLFNFFYSARDWNTFYQAAAWARNRFNPQQFAYAFTAAVLNHPSTQGVFIPALYEVFPHEFVPATALQKIYNAKFQGYKFATVYANYTNQNQNNKNYNNYFVNNGNYNRNYNYNQHNPNSAFAENDGSLYNNAGVPENPENRVSYFREDVGINAFHAAFHAKNPSFFGSNYVDKNYWISSNYYTNGNGNTYRYNYHNQDDLKRGEEFYYAHQQLYARYILERLSNNLPIPKPINFNKSIKPGYNPRLQYANGEAVPARPPYAQFQQLFNNENNNNDNAQLPNNNQAQNPVVYEQRLQAVADSGFVINEDGSKTKLNSKNGVAILANLAAAPGRSPNPSYYGNYYSTATNAIGNIVDPNNQNGVAPGAVSNYATAARDPAYYKFLAKFLQIFNNFQNNQGPYAQAELSFPGVKIQSFDVSSLITYFQNFVVNVNNAVNENPNSGYSNYQNNKCLYENPLTIATYKNHRYNYRNGNKFNNVNYNNDYNNNYDYDYSNNNNNARHNVNNNNNYNNQNNNNYKNNDYNYNNYNDYDYNSINNNKNNNYNNDYNGNNNYNNDYNNNNDYNGNINYNNDYNGNNNYNNDYNNNNDYNVNNNYNNDYNNNNDYDNNYNGNNNNNFNRNGNYWVKFQRLTHKPYNYNLAIQSSRNTNAVVRVFIGPKFDSNGQEFTLPQASQYFVQLDQFSVQLQTGQNNVQRSSQQSPSFSVDAPNFQQLWNLIQNAKNGQQFYAKYAAGRHFRFPQRVQLPKGKVGGQQFVFYAIVTESSGNINYNNNYNGKNYNDYESSNNNNNNNNNYNDYDDDYTPDNNNNYNYVNYNRNSNNNYNYYKTQDYKSIGFPFDRPVQDANYKTANQVFKTVTIYHKNVNYN